MGGKPVTIDVLKNATKGIITYPNSTNSTNTTKPDLHLIEAEELVEYPQPYAPLYRANETLHNAVNNVNGTLQPWKMFGNPTIPGLPKMKMPDISISKNSTITNPSFDYNGKHVPLSMDSLKNATKDLKKRM